MIASSYDLLLIIVKDRKIIIASIIFFTIFALGLSLIIPKKYKATATLMPPVTQSMNLMTMMFSKSLMSDPEIGGTGYMPGMVTPSDIFAYMLKSGAISSIVVEECNLVNYYKKQKYFINNPRKTMYEVNKMLNKSTSIDVSEERFISITVQDKNPAKAAEIANKYGDALDRVYTKLNMTQGRTMREFIEGRLRQEEHLLKSSEDSLNAFQNKYRTVSLDDEMKAVIEMSAQIEAQIVSKKIEFEAMKTYGNEDNPQIKALQNQIAKAEQQLAEIIQGRRDKNIFVPFSKAPDVGMALGRRLRDVKIHQEVYLLLVQQLEQAKILEAKDTPKIQFLERASPPWKKSWPKRMFIVLFGFVIGCLAGILIVLIRNWWEWIMNDPEMSSKYKHIFNLLSN